MVRRSTSWNGRGHKSRKARRGLASRAPRESWSAGPVLSVEQLEGRYMLSANLSIAPNQFFGQNTQPLVAAYEVPFRATFTDVLEQADIDNGFHFYSATINWGDGSLLEFSGEPNGTSEEGGPNVGIVFHTNSDLFTGAAVGDPIT